MHEQESTASAVWIYVLLKINCDFWLWLELHFKSVL